MEIFSNYVFPKNSRHKFRKGASWEDWDKIVKEKLVVGIDELWIAVPTESVGSAASEQLHNVHFHIMKGRALEARRHGSGTALAALRVLEKPLPQVQDLCAFCAFDILKCNLKQIQFSSIFNFLCQLWHGVG